MVVQTLGCIGIGLVWGWITEQSLETGVKVLRFWILWSVMTFAVCCEIQYMGVGHALAFCAIASVTSLVIRFIWVRKLRLGS
jgi:hypothetical protein